MPLACHPTVLKWPQLCISVRFTPVQTLEQRGQPKILVIKIGTVWHALQTAPKLLALQSVETFGVVQTGASPGPRADPLVRGTV